MRQRLIAILGVAIFSIFLAAPAGANVLTSANATDDCTGFTLVVTGKDLSQPSSVTYKITLASGGNSRTIHGSMYVAPNQNGFFRSMQSRDWSTYGLTLNGTYTLTGSATLISSGSTLPINFSQSTLTCTYGSCMTGAVSNFNDNGFSSSDTIWFNSVFKISGVPQSGAIVSMNNSTIMYSAGGTNYTIKVPDATMYFASNVTSATTLFTDHGWDTALPTMSTAGNDFASAIQVPANSGPPAGTKNILWSATFSSETPGLSVNFQWGAAVYSNFSTKYNVLGVKPVDDNQASKYQNSDHAGTPENYKNNVVGGGTGGGGSNYTGSYSGTGSCGLQPGGELVRTRTVRWIRR